MKTIIFDTSSIISLATNNLLYTLNPLKKQFNGQFFMPESVHEEVIDNPMRSRRYKLEAFLIEDLFSTGILEKYDNAEIKQEAIKLLDMLNNTFYSRNNPIKILDLAEVESLVMAKKLGSEAYVVDERTIRLIVENPESLSGILKEKLHSKITTNNDNLRIIKQNFSSIKILRSTELMLVAYKLGIFDSYIKTNGQKKDFIDGLLWALKLHGCSISDKEIDQLVKMKNL